MPIVAIENIGSLGVVMDMEPRILPPEAWSSAENMIFKDGAAEGYRREYIIDNAPAWTPRWLLPWATATNFFWLIATADKIYRTEDFITYTDLSKAGGTYSPGDPPIWTGGVFGGVPLMNGWNFADYPQSWNSSSAEFEDLPNWNSNWYCRTIRPYKNYLIAMNTQESGEHYPTRVRWSHPADPGTVPISWDDADPTMDAGSYSLSDTTSPLIDCLPLGDYNVLYKEDSTWIQRLVGGQFIFDTSRMLRSKGLLTINGVQEFYRKHFVVGTGDIWVHDGQQARSIATKRVRDTFFSELLEDYYRNLFIVANYPKDEMWLCYPRFTGSYNGACDRALVWNWADDTWVFRDLPYLFHANLGTLNLTPPGDSYNDQTGKSYDASTRIYDVRGYSPVDPKIVGGGNGGPRSANEFLQMELTWQALEWGNQYSSLERQGLGIVGRDRQGNWKIDQTNVKFLRAVYPQLTHSTPTNVSIYIGTQMLVEDPITWHGPYAFNASTMQKIDCTLAGRIFSIRFITSGYCQWTLDGYKLDMDLVGQW